MVSTYLVFIGGMIFALIANWASKHAQRGFNVRMDKSAPLSVGRNKSPLKQMRNTYELLKKFNSGEIDVYLYVTLTAALAISALIFANMCIALSIWSFGKAPDDSVNFLTWNLIDQIHFIAATVSMAAAALSVFLAGYGFDYVIRIAAAWGKFDKLQEFFAEKDPG